MKRLPKLTEEQKEILAHQQRKHSEFIPFADLWMFGIPYSRMHILRLIKAKKFPSPVRIGPARVAFTRESIDKHVAEIKNTPVVYRKSKAGTR